ncbi:hypothetical protein [Pseudomonas sp. NW5]|uniref:hypothetical protein n=1 Tax=Pseudomonas sp. NW5 TaxID=2934934 RepID=UPI00202288B8|nr:hypothetical protein [Pseudomonas sp. NW5]MCL7462530.1 hypothetical protein [Pseudomonas sp. NW5]
MRQPDIEIYLKDVELPAVSAWLEQAIGPCTPWQTRGQVQRCTAGGIPVTWLPKAIGRWSSLLLESDQTPWADDLACAQAAFAALGVQVRCAPGSWSEEQGEADADRWLKVSAEGVSEIQWRTD